MFLPNVLDRIPDFKFYPDDVLIQTYPKAGKLIFTRCLQESCTAVSLENLNCHTIHQISLLFIVYKIIMSPEWP